MMGVVMEVNQKGSLFPKVLVGTGVPLVDVARVGELNEAHQASIKLRWKSDLILSVSSIRKILGRVPYIPC